MEGCQCRVIATHSGCRSSKVGGLTVMQRGEGGRGVRRDPRASVREIGVDKARGAIRCDDLESRLTEPPQRHTASAIDGKPKYGGLDVSDAQWRKAFDDKNAK